MTARTFLVPNAFLLGAMGVAFVATGVLIAFPGNLLVWQVSAWTLVAALLALLGLVVASGYALATSRVARTWQRIATFTTGLATLAVVAIGSL